MENSEILCPVCEVHRFKKDGDYDICTICGWENDNVQNADKDYSGGANELSVNQSKKLYNLLKNPLKKDLTKELIKKYKEKKYQIYEEFGDIDYTTTEGERISEAFNNNLIEMMRLVEELENEEIY